MNDQPDPEATLIKRRFIAGAICPECRAEDKLRVDYWRTETGERQVQGCVACGYSRTEETVADEPLPTLPRIRRGQQSPQVESQPVRLMDPASLTPPSDD